MIAVCVLCEQVILTFGIQNLVIIWGFQGWVIVFKVHVVHAPNIHIWIWDINVLKAIR